MSLIGHHYNTQDLNSLCRFCGIVCICAGIGACISGGPVGFGIGIPLIIYGVYIYMTH